MADLPVLDDDLVVDNNADVVSIVDIDGLG